MLDIGFWRWLDFGMKMIGWVRGAAASQDGANWTGPSDSQPPPPSSDKHCTLKHRRKDVRQPSSEDKHWFTFFAPFHVLPDLVRERERVEKKNPLWAEFAVARSIEAGKRLDCWARHRMHAGQVASSCMHLIPSDAQAEPSLLSHPKLNMYSKYLNVTKLSRSIFYCSLFKREECSHTAGLGQWLATLPICRSPFLLNLPSINHPRTGSVTQQHDIFWAQSVQAENRYRQV